MENLTWRTGTTPHCIATAVENLYRYTISHAGSGVELTLTHEGGCSKLEGVLCPDTATAKRRAQAHCDSYGRHKL